MDNWMNYSELLTLCQKRRSCRSFSHEPLSAEQIEKIRTIALTSPYASGKKSWEIVTVTEKEIIARMALAVNNAAEKIAAGIETDYKDNFLSYAKYFRIFDSAPALFIPVFRISPVLTLMLDTHGTGSLCNDTVKEISEWERDNYVKSISCVAMLILLAAESLGLSSCYMTGPLLAENELAAIINIKPGRSIGALIPVGYANSEKKIPGRSK